MTAFLLILTFGGAQPPWGPTFKILQYKSNVCILKFWTDNLSLFKKAFHQRAAKDFCLKFCYKISQIAINKVGRWNPNSCWTWLKSQYIYIYIHTSLESENPPPISYRGSSPSRICRENNESNLVQVGLNSNLTRLTHTPPRTSLKPWQIRFRLDLILLSFIEFRMHEILMQESRH